MSKYSKNKHRDQKVIKELVKRSQKRESKVEVKVSTKKEKSRGWWSFEIVKLSEAPNNVRNYKESANKRIKRHQQDMKSMSNLISQGKYKSEWASEGQYQVGSHVEWMFSMSGGCKELGHGQIIRLYQLGSANSDSDNHDEDGQVYALVSDESLGKLSIELYKLRIMSPERIQEVQKHQNDQIKALQSWEPERGTSHYASRYGQKPDEDDEDVFDYLVKEDRKRMEAEVDYLEKMHQRARIDEVLAKAAAAKSNNTSSTSIISTESATSKSATSKLISAINNSNSQQALIKDISRQLQETSGNLNTHYTFPSSI
jgi:hypothetical protein